MAYWIVKDPDHLGGSPRVGDPRIAVALMLESLATGQTVAELLDAYPSLSEEAVKGVLSELAQREAGRA